MTRSYDRYQKPTDAISKRQFDREVDRNVVWRETEQRKRRDLKQRIQRLEALVASWEAFRDRG